MDKYSAETVKFALLQTNYRGDINVTDNLFPDAEKHLVDFYKVFKLAEDKGIKIEGEYKEIDDEFNSAMSDDFNTALAISNLFGYFKKAKAKINDGDLDGGRMLAQIKKTYDLLGFFREDVSAFIKAYAKDEKIEVPSEIEAIAQERLVARQNKDWAKSDELRDLLAQKGYEIKDSKDGYTLTKKD